MAPEPVQNPDRRFVLTKLVGGVETNVTAGNTLPNNYATDAPQRVPAMDNAKLLRLADPDAVYLLYSPSNGGPHTDGDLIWDSRVSG